MLENISGSEELCERLLANRRTRAILEMHDNLGGTGSGYEQAVRIIDTCCSFLGCRTGALFRPDTRSGNPELLGANGRIERNLPPETMTALRNTLYGSQKEEYCPYKDGVLLVIPLPSGQHLTAAGLFAGVSSGRRLRKDDIRLAGIMLYQAAQLLYHTHDRDGIDNPPVSGELEQKLKKVIAYIAQNYERDISREGLASLADIHPDYFSRMFNKYTGKKISDYINEVRINRACELLTEENPKTVIEIAFAVGFESLRTFNRAFAAVTGMTPSVYRRNIQGNHKNSIGF
jgi:AraC-like DNA-binding protein